MGDVMTGKQAVRESSAGAMGAAGRVSGAMAGHEGPTLQGTPQTPHPPKGTPSVFPCKGDPSLQKNSRKKPAENIPGVHRVCLNCYYALPGDTNALTCRANAPRPSSTTSLSMWPAVLPDDWCGEWASAKEMMTYDPDDETARTGVP